MTAIALGLDQSLRFTRACNREDASAGRGASRRFEVRLPFCFSCSQLGATFAAFISFGAVRALLQRKAGLNKKVL